MTGGKPLMEALKDRQTSRSYSPEKLSEQTLSNLLWAAWGINRTESGKRTAPSARNFQEIDVYVALKEGMYLYNPQAHQLELVVAKDLRKMTGTQPFVENAPVNLVYVADYDRMGTTSEENKDFYAAVDTGFVSQNVYLFCASEGLATVVRGMVPRQELAAEMGLKPTQRIVLAQSVGYPAK
ncbi:MAG: nitroreductase family protein [Planctomycetes bacterium]|nr:nitroreductase family protein [Planctomycetota bacterium]